MLKMKDLEKKTTTIDYFFTNKVMMVRPAFFGFNDQTAATNFFQLNQQVDDVLRTAVVEFDNMVEVLKTNGIEVLVFEDNADDVKPDAIFPNNWFSTHKNKMYLYPMLAPNRRLERRQDIIKKLKKEGGYKTIVDLSDYENQNVFLEGTGSMIFNHHSKKIYAGLSPRTHKPLVKKMADELNYEPVLFTANDENGNAIYHTNVMLTIGNGFAVLCLESITKEEDKRHVIKNLNADGLEILEINFEQMQNFCGNLLQLINYEGEPVLVMSEQAKNSFSPLLIEMIQRFTKILVLSIPTIETIGGGGARCMMGEVY